jgi:hypothetical protein
MCRQMCCIKYNIPSNRTVKCSLHCHKALNRAHSGSFQMTVFLLTECIIFDVYLTLASWSGQLPDPVVIVCSNIQINISDTLKNFAKTTACSSAHTAHTSAILTISCLTVYTIFWRGRSSTSATSFQI